MCAALAVAQPAVGADAGQRAVKNVEIAYTGNTLGLVEPCGCREAMRGGLARRATVIRRLLAEHPKLLLLDAGDLLGPDSDRFKVPLIAESLDKMGYWATGLGSWDLAWSPSLLPILEGRHLQVVCGNVPLGKPVRPWALAIVNGIRVGVTGAVPGASGAEAALLQRLEQMRRQCDLVVLLSTRGSGDDRRTARRSHAVDIVIGMAGGPGKAAAQRVGTAWLLSVAREAGDVRLARVEWVSQSHHTVRVAVETLLLDNKVPDDKEMAQRVERYYDQVAKELVASPGYGVSDAGYGVARACAFCHASPYRKWQRTAHSGAYRTLKRRHRENIPECLQCHSEYYRQTRRPATAARHQAGVECASCHGDSLSLILRPSQVAAHAKPKEATCRGCHTKEKSPQFDFAKYKRRIKHW